MLSRREKRYRERSLAKHARRHGVSDEEMRDEVDTSTFQERIETLEDTLALIEEQYELLDERITSLEVAAIHDDS